MPLVEYNNFCMKSFLITLQLFAIYHFKNKTRRAVVPTKISIQKQKPEPPASLSNSRGMTRKNFKVLGDTPREPGFATVLSHKRTGYSPAGADV